jgi:hypothetical protein
MCNIGCKHQHILHMHGRHALGSAELLQAQHPQLLQALNSADTSKTHTHTARPACCTDATTSVPQQAYCCWLLSNAPAGPAWPLPPHTLLPLQLLLLAMLLLSCCRPKCADTGP